MAMAEGWIRWGCDRGVGIGEVRGNNEDSWCKGELDELASGAESVSTSSSFAAGIAKPFMLISKVGSPSAEVMTPGKACSSSESSSEGCKAAQ